MKKMSFVSRKNFSRLVEGLNEHRRNPLKKIGIFRIRCNLCSKMFRTTTRMSRFCRACKAEDEAFRFAEWLTT